MKLQPSPLTQAAAENTPPVTPHTGWNTRAIGHITGKIVPLGVLCLLTGMVWAGERQLFHQLFYLLIALPAFILALTSAQLRGALFRNPVFIAFLCFATYVSISIAWSGSGDGPLSLLKRPLYVMLLFVAVSGVALYRPDRLRQVLHLSAIFAVISGGVLLALFHFSGNVDRLTGYGALRNPLLTSHIFGFFLILWIAYWIQQRRLLPPNAVVAVIVLGALILATGSRTPLLALAMATLWLGMMSGDRRGVIACGLLALVGGVIVAVWPEAIAQRGLSYRPEIWADAFRQALDRPLFGHGYDHPFRVWVEGIDFALWEPHNMTLSVFHQGGVVGLLLWGILYLVTLLGCWKRRANPLVFALSATVVYGLAASMTEGGSFLSRPKEHWFLIWIPIALTAAVLLKANEDER